MRKYNKTVLLMGAFLIALNISACGRMKEDETPNVNVSAINGQGSRMQMTESIYPETFPVGEFHDDMGSQLIISQADDPKYTIQFGIYKSMYTENAEGSYDISSGVLSFSGTDISDESKISADVAIQGDNLLVTLTHSEHLKGETFEFEPGQP